MSTKETSTVTGCERAPIRQEAVVIFAIMLLAVALRLYLIRFHDVISVDGTSYVGTARALSVGDIHGLSIYGFYPVLIWLTSLMGLGMEMAARFVSAVMGGLLVIPLYLLGAEMFSRRTALAACLVAAVWPPLVGWSCEVMTQATYITLSMTGVCFVWGMIKKPSVTRGVAAGTFLALAFLTRPEGFLLFFVTPLVPLFMRRRELRGLWRTLAAYGGSFLFLSMVNAFLVHHVTGTWQMSAKTNSALSDALSYYLQMPELNYVPSFKAVGYLDILRRYPDFIWTNTFKNLREIWNTLLPVPLWILSLIGLLAGGFKPGKIIPRLFLLSTFAPLCVIITFYYASLEYTQEYLPVLFLFAGEGFGWFERLVVARIPSVGKLPREKWMVQGSLTLAVTVIFAGTVLLRQIPSNAPPVPYVPESDGGRRDQKNIGLLLKENLPPGKIMTRWARIAYYAERDWVTIPKSGLDEILRTARESGVRFIIVDAGLSVYRPELGILLEPVISDNAPERALLVTPTEPLLEATGLRPYLLYRDPSSMGIAVYEVVS